MKTLVISSFVLVIAAFASAAPIGEQELLAAFDFDTLFNDEKMRTEAFDCLLDKGPCKPEYKALKDMTLKTMKNECSECNPEQKAKYEKVMKTFHDRFEPVYNEVMAKINKS